MNLKELNSRPFLESLAENSTLLIEKIKETHGYVLQRMEEEKIFPPLDYFLANIKPVALNFIIKNYDLTREQTALLRPFFQSHNEATNKISNDVLSSDEIIEHLQNKQPLTEKTIIPLEIIQSYSKEIRQQINNDEYLTLRVLTNSLKPYDHKVFLSLDRKLLKKAMGLFDEFSEWFEYPEVRKTYKELMTEITTANNRLMQINHFRHYLFTEEDRVLLEDLLAHDTSYNPNYKEIAQIPGVKQMVSGLDYFRRFNTKNFTQFTLAELQEHKEEFQERILEILQLDKYRGLKEIFHLSFNSTEDFKTVIDEDFFKKAMHKISGEIFVQSDSDRQEEREKGIHLKKMALDYFVSTDTEGRTKFSISTVLEELERLSESMNHRDYAIEKINHIYQNNLIEFMNSDSVAYYAYYTKSNFLLGKQCDMLLKEFAEKNPSENLFFLLCDHYDNAKNSRYYKNESQVKFLDKLLTSMAPRLDKTSVKMIAEHFDYKLPFLGLKNRKTTYKNNFTLYKEIPFEEISRYYMPFLTGVKGFRDYVLENRFVLPKDTLHHMINQNENKDYVAFLHDYFKIHPLDRTTQAGQEIYKSLLTHERVADIIEIDNKAYEIEQYELFVQKSQKQSELKKEITAKKEKLPRKNDYYEDENPLTPIEKEVKILGDKIESLDKEIREIKGHLSANFIESKLHEIIQTQAFDELDYLRKYNLNAPQMEIFENYVNQCDFHSMLKNIENPVFIKLLKKSVGYNGKTAISLNYGERENMILAELLNTQGEDPEKALAFFSKEGLGFAKEYLIKVAPVRLFYQYSLRPETDEKSYISDNAHYIYGAYTGEQIIRAFAAAEKESNYFNFHEVNSHTWDFFQENFQHDEKAFLDFLEKAQDYPKLYAVLANARIFQDFAKWDYEKGETSDYAQHNYFIKHYDWNTVLKGLSMIMDEVNNSQDDYEKGIHYGNKHAKAVFSHVVALTRYEEKDRDSSGDYKYQSNLGEEKTEEIVKLFFDKATFFMSDINRLGTYLPFSEHFARNMDKFMQEDSVQKMIFMNPKMCPDNFALDGYTGQNLRKMTEGLLDYLIEKNESEKVRYLSYLAEQSIFLNREVDYSFQASEEIPHSEVFSAMAGNPSFMKKLSSAKSNFFLDQVLLDKPVVKRKNNKI